MKGVLTGKDFKGWKWGWMPKTREEEPLATEKVRYLGEAVAAVAAMDEDTAEEAAQFIQVEYEELPGVFDPEEAMKEGAPQIHEHAENNLSWDFHMDFGDVEKGFRRRTWCMKTALRRAGLLPAFWSLRRRWPCRIPAGITICPPNRVPISSIAIWPPVSIFPCPRSASMQPFIGGGFGGTKNDSLAGDFCSVCLPNDRKTGEVRLHHGRSADDLPATS